MTRILLLLALLLPVIRSSAVAARAAELSYERDVRPILKANCFHCHGEGHALEGSLDLRLRRLIAQGGDSGPAIVAGHPDDSPLWTRVRDGEMPPEEIEKKLTAQEKETLRQWIAQGAKTLREEPADVDPNDYLTEEERGFWSFQPIRRPASPAADDRPVRTSIDRFVTAKLQEKELSLSAEADKQTLIRRLSIDLLGLPPTVDEVEAFVQDSSPDAYERLVDRLLSSPRYGERWGRHWLDAAGYADSEGYDDVDALRPDAWKYRDYVLRAWNDDKPFDRFIHEQLAGDELIGRELKDLKPDEVECLVATGFLRMAPDGTANGAADQAVARNETVAKTIDIVSSSLLGLTVGCAQCHNHRYDPITHVDYYAVRAIFEPALNWKDWLAPPARRVSLYTDADRQAAADIEKKAKEIEAERKKKEEEFIQQTLEKELAKLPAELHESLRAARDTPVAKRTPEQKQLLGKYPSINVSSGSLYLYDRKAADELKKMADEAAAIRKEKPVEQFVRAAWERSGRPVPKTFLFDRGLHEQPKQEVPPRPPRVLTLDRAVEISVDDDTLPSTGRRLAFAKWLTGSQNPLTARVIANRIWLHHFGRGLVATPGDFGFLGARPSHPELLDWLGSELRDSGWSVKHIQRLIVTSATYRQSSTRRADAEAVDPENELYWRMPIRRLDAEALRDSVLAVSDRLNLKAFGPSVPVMADVVGQTVIGIENLNAGRPGAVIPMKGEEFRRSVFVQVRRSRPLSVLDPFDLPRMEPNCVVRSASTVATQSLLLMNNEFITDNAAALAERVLHEHPDDLTNQIRAAWQITYAAQPDSEELADAEQYVLEQAQQYAAQEGAAADATEAAAGKPAAEKGKTPAAKPDPQRDALTTFCHALLSSNRFLYVD